MEYTKDVNKKYYDMERNAYSFPPPRYTPRRFIFEKQYPSCFRPQDRLTKVAPEMPLWMMRVLAKDGNGVIEHHRLTCDELRHSVKNWKAWSFLLKG